MTPDPRDRSKLLLQFLTSLGGIIVAVVVSLTVLSQNLSSPWEVLSTTTSSRQEQRPGNRRSETHRSPTDHQPSISTTGNNSSGSFARSEGEPRIKSGGQDRGLTTSTDASPDLGAQPNLVDQAMSLIQAGRPQEAKAQLAQLLRDDPNNFDALIAMGVLTKESLGNPAEAQPFFEKALGLNPSNQFVLNELITLYGEQNQYSEGLRYLEDLSSRNPTSSAVLQGRARILSQMGKEADAIPLLNAVAMGPDSTPQVWSELSQAYLKTGDYESSLSVIDRMIAQERAASGDPNRGSHDTEEQKKRVNILKLNKADILISRGNKTKGDLQLAEDLLDDVASSTGDDAQLALLRRRLAENI